MRKYKTSVIPLALLVAATGVISFFMFQSSNVDGRVSIAGDVGLAASKYFSALDGRVVKNSDSSAPQVVAVMVDNFPDAKPQSGLSKAKIVYEVPMEGELTRFMAIYESNQDVSKVGPVRSARPYFLDWLQEYGQALYMHSGGSPVALKLIKSRNINDANEFYWGGYYWREEGRAAPHNLYTASKNWQEIINRKNINDGFYSTNSWKYARVVGKAAAGKINKEINILFDNNYIVAWKYDAKKLDYVRYVNGEKDLDNGSEIRARNILTQTVGVKVLDSEGRKEITTIGNGEAKILRKGKLFSGTWEKKTLSGRTRFYVDKKEVVLLPGITWVEVVSKNTKIEIIN